MVYLVVSFLLAISYYSYIHLEELKVHPFTPRIFSRSWFLFSLLLAWFINRVLLQEDALFFKSSIAFEFFSRFLLENNLYLVKKGQT